MTTSIYNTKFVIYKHTNNITGKSYIGKTIKGIDIRWKRHLCDTVCGSYNSHFHNAIRKYGTDCWDHIILYISFEQDDKHLYEVEEQLILDWDTYHNGYNTTIGGRGTGSGESHIRYNTTHTQKSKEKMSNIKLGKNNPMFGKHHSEEAKRKVSESRIGGKHHKFRGYYIYNNTKFSSSKSLGESICVSQDVVLRWCKHNYKQVHYNSYNQSKFLQSLGTKEEIVGLTFKELGFDFIIS